MSTPKRTVLITGCSDGGLGAGLAVAFHEAGLHVYATARSVSKMKDIAALGIETLELDVQSDASIAACVSKVPILDILINNAGAGYSMPIVDADITQAKKLFDLNVWSYIAVTQAFLPLLLKSKGMIVNHTSTASIVAVPFQGVYGASKAAMAMFSNTLRLELEPFDIKVIDMKTGLVMSNFFNNQKEATQTSLPEGSIYLPARDAVEKAMRGDEFAVGGIPVNVWAKQVVQDLSRKTPPPIVYRGRDAWSTWFSTFLPFGTIDGMIKRLRGVDVVERMVRK